LSSVFAIQDFVAHRTTYFKTTHRNALKEAIRSLIPMISKTSGPLQTTENGVNC